MSETTTTTTPVTPAAPIPGQTSPNSAPPVKTAVVAGDQDKLGEWADLRRQLREATSKATAAETKAAEHAAKVAELEQLRGGADKAGAVEKLVKEGKLVAAMQAAGVELEAAFAQWVEESEGKAAPAAPSQELLDLKAKYDAIEARLKGEDDAKKAAEEDAKKRGDESGRAEVLKGLSDKITAEGARWVRCAKEPGEASDSALSVAQEKARDVVAKRAAEKGIDLTKPLTAEQARAVSVTDAEATELFDLALDAVEAEYKALAEKFYIAEAPRVRPATVPHIGDYLRKPGSPPRDSSTGSERKAAVTLDGQRGSLRTPKEQETRGKLTADEAKAKALRAIRSMQAGR